MQEIYLVVSSGMDFFKTLDLKNFSQIFNNQIPNIFRNLSLNLNNRLNI